MGRPIYQVEDFEQDELHKAYMEDVDELLAELRMNMSDLIGELIDQVEDLDADNTDDDDDSEWS